MKIFKISMIGISMVISFACSNLSSQNEVYKPLKVIEQSKQLNMIGHWKGEGDRQFFVENLVREYEFKNQELKINLKYPEDVYFDKENRNGLSEFVAEQYLANNGEWDILMLNGENDQVSGYVNESNWSNKFLVDFNQIEEFRAGTVPELLTEQSRAYWNGIIPGPFVEGQYWALWTNKKVANKLGVDVQQTGMTPEYFLECIKAVYDYNQKNPESYIAPIFESYTWNTLDLLGLMLYSSQLNSFEDFNQDKVSNYKLKAWEKTLKFAEEASKYKPIYKDMATAEWVENQAIMTNGECLFYVNGSWMYNIWKGIDEKEVLNCVPCEFPGFKKHVVYPATYIATWGVPKMAKNKKEAIEFLLAMNKPDVAETWSRYTKCPTGIKGNLATSNFGHDQYGIFTNYITSTFEGKTFAYFSSPAWVVGKESGYVNLYFFDVLHGEITAAEAMKQIRRSLKLN